MVDSLTACHAALQRLMGPDMEPLSVIQRVEQHRWYWRPAKPRVVLLAESHVYTTTTELGHSLRPVAQLPPDLPRGFVRLVYCLGYGENALLDTRITSNRGTPPFWKLFYGCLHPVARNEDFTPVEKGRTPLLAARLANKIAVRAALKARGVWLVDASIAALCPKPSQQIVDRALHASWDGYICTVIAEAAPQAVLVIGRAVERALRSRLDHLGVPWEAMPQPNSKQFADNQFRIFGTCHRVCENPGPFEPNWISRLPSHRPRQ